MDVDTHNGEPGADPARLIRLTLRGHCVRWRLDKELAASSATCEPPARRAGRRRKVR